MNEARFIYLFKQQGEAVCMTGRNDHSGELLFTCPADWAPKNQLQFIQAARYYGVQNPERIKYCADEIPF